MNPLQKNDEGDIIFYAEIVVNITTRKSKPEDM